MNDNTTQSPLMDSYESSEIALMDSFKAAALKVTTLYKDSLVQNRKAYVSGYQQALQDLYEFINSHPTTTVSQQDTFMSPTDGLLPVQDLLAYARQRNDQLTSEMGISTGMDQATSLSSSATSEPQQPQTQTTSSTNVRPISFDSTVRSQQQDFSTGVDSPSNQLGSTESVTDTVCDRTNMVGGGATTTRGSIGVTVKNAFNPFQIDPSTQFTFSLPVNEQQPWHHAVTADHHHHLHRSRNHHHHYHYHPHPHHHHHANSNSTSPFNSNNNSNNNNHHPQCDHIDDMNEDDDDMNDLPHSNNNNNNTTFSGFPMDGTSKRRFTQQELTFMGRALNNMNIDTPWNEPPLKRRFKKDD